MTTETEIKQGIRGKLSQARRLLQETTDPTTSESLGNYIEELEGRLVTEMGDGPPK